MYENELYALIDNLAFILLLLGMVVTLLIVEYKNKVLLSKLDGYFDYKLERYNIELAFHQSKLLYKKQRLDYKLKIKELKYKGAIK